MGITSFGVAVRAAHWLPPTCPRVAVKQDQATVFSLRDASGPQDIVSGNCHIAMDVSFARFSRNNPVH